MTIGYRPGWGVSAGLLVVVLFALSLAPVASAGTISVTTTFDQLDGSAPCSLREAVNTANAGRQQRRLHRRQPGRRRHDQAGRRRLQPLGGPASRTPTPAAISTSRESLTIAGAGADLSGIDGNGAITGDRVLHVTSGTLTISGLTVHDGSAWRHWRRHSSTAGRR